MNRTLVVTGASGFVGGALCRAAVAAGYDVLALGRRAAVDPGTIGGAPYLAWDLAAACPGIGPGPALTPGPAPGPGHSHVPGPAPGVRVGLGAGVGLGADPEFGPESTKGFIAESQARAGTETVTAGSPPPGLPGRFARPDAVVHCAGLATDWARPAEFHQGNVMTTEAILAAFPNAARFVHMSTASVYDPRKPTVLATEDEADGVRHPDAYGRSKAMAENYVRRVRPDAVILRPHAVYGPGDTTLLPRLLRAVRRTPRGPRLFAVGDGRQRLSLTGIDNLTDACLLAVAGSASGTFNIADHEPVILDVVLRQVLMARGITAPPVYLPAALALPLAGGAQLAATVGRAFGADLPPLLTTYAVRHLAYERTLDITAARNHLGYCPSPTDIAPALVTD